MDRDLIFSVETMIWAVEERPELWDSLNETYRDRNNKREGWKQVCSYLFEDFEEKSDKVKTDIEKAVITKWRSVRDRYVREKRKAEDCHKSGAGAKPCHRYVYAERLTFLNKCVQLRQNEDSVTPGSSNDPVEPNKDIDPSRVQSIEPRETYVHKSKADAVRSGVEQDLSAYLRKASEIMEKRQAAFAQDDEDMSFFKSVLPSVRRLNETKKFQFRMQVMSDLQSLLATPTVTPHLPAAQAHCEPRTPTAFYPIPLQQLIQTQQAQSLSQAQRKRRRECCQRNYQYRLSSTSAVRGLMSPIKVEPIQSPHHSQPESSERPSTSPNVQTLSDCSSTTSTSGVDFEDEDVIELV